MTQDQMNEFTELNSDIATATSALEKVLKDLDYLTGQMERLLKTVEVQDDRHL